MLIPRAKPARPRRDSARAWAGEAGAAPDAQAWQDAQRLLEPLAVRIPFAQRLTFPSRTTHDRRGNTKLLGLVASHALLCQRKRERDAQGHVVALTEDYRVVHALLRPVLERDLDGLSPLAARLYRALAQGEFSQPSRREAATFLGCSYNTAKSCLEGLVAQELATVCDVGPPRRYRVLDASALGASGHLTDPGELESLQ